jgi:hypothetical protein
MICSLSYHLGCVDINKGTCYACLGNQHQIDHYNNIAEETALPIVRRETTATFNEISLLLFLYLIWCTSTFSDLFHFVQSVQSQV